MRTKAWMCWWITCPLRSVLSCEYHPGLKEGTYWGGYSPILFRRGKVKFQQVKMGMGIPGQEEIAQEQLEIDRKAKKVYVWGSAKTDQLTRMDGKE